MGFWGSLVDGAKSAGGWVLNHSGDIAKTVGTVVKVVGVIGPLQVNATTTDDSGTQIKDFFNNFDIASDKLAGIAKSALHRQAAISSGAMGESIEGATKEDSISGIWKHPAPLAQGQPPLDMYQDLSKWLAILGVPASPDVDVAAAAAQAIVLEPEEVPAEERTLIRTLDFEYSDPSGKWRLDVAHAYYPLPLGPRQEDYCWHSCVHGRFTQFQSLAASMVAASSADSTLATTVSTSHKITKDIPIWLINVAITWDNVTATAKASPLLVNQLEKDENRRVKHATLLGCSLIVQVQGGAGDTPSTLQNNIVSGSAQVLSTLYAGTGISTDTDNSMPSLVPEVEITNTQVVSI